MSMTFDCGEFSMLLFTAVYAGAAFVIFSSINGKNCAGGQEYT